jgi:hypothetical protein
MDWDLNGTSRAETDVLGAMAVLFRPRLLPLAVLLVMSVSGAATAANPWQLRCASMPTERPMPAAVQAAALTFFPWIRPAERGLEAGPVYLVALSSRTAISRDGDEQDGSRSYLHRALIAIAPSQPGVVTVSGRRVGGGRRAILGFSANGATRCTVHPPNVSCGWRSLRFASALRIAPHAGWRIVQTELRIGRTGCFRLTARGAGLRVTIPLAVPGPDYGTAGW